MNRLATVLLILFSASSLLAAVNPPPDTIPGAYNGLPAGATGDLIRAVNYTRGIWLKTTGQWIALNGEVANVKEFGAVGDGVTDDTDEIEDAIASVSGAVGIASVRGGTGGVVYFPPGVYKISRELTIIKPGVWLRGAGALTSRIVVPASGTFNAVRFVGIVGPPGGIRDLGIISEGVVGSNVTGVVIDNCASMNVEQVWTNGLKFGLVLTGSGDSDVRDSLFERSKHYGVRVHLSDGIRISGVHSFDNDMGGFLLEQAKTHEATQPPHPVVLTGCQTLFGEAGRGANAVIGYHVKNYSNVSFVGCQVGDYESTRPDTGFRIDGSERITISAPTVTHAWNHGIHVTGSTQVAISDAMITRIGDYNTPPVSTATVAGILVDSASEHVSIQGGSITRSGGYGVKFGARFGQIVNLHIIDPVLLQSATAGDAAIEIDAPATGEGAVVVSSNVLRLVTAPARGTAIRLTSGQNIIVSQNRQLGGFHGALARAAGLGQTIVTKNTNFVNDEDAGIDMNIAGTTLSPTNAIHRINSPGSTLQTINAPSWCPLGCTVVLVPLSTFSVGTAGNIGRATTALVGQPLAMTYAGGTWYPSY